MTIVDKKQLVEFVCACYYKKARCNRKKPVEKTLYIEANFPPKNSFF